VEVASVIQKDVPIEISGPLIGIALALAAQAQFGITRAHQFETSTSRTFADEIETME
jgi:hypothetical protein